MHKKEFIQKVAEKGNITLRQSEEMTNLILETIKDTVLNEEELIFFGFGKFYIGINPERKGTDPRDSSPIIIPETKVLKFKPSTAIKKVLKNR